VSQPRKVLICGADPEFVRWFRERHLPSDRYMLIDVPSAESLLRKVYDEMPHLVIVDIHSSDIGAFDICGQMKFDIILGHIPLVVITDSNPFGSRIDCGADLYLQRPVNLEELVYHVERIISKTIDELDINPLTHLPGNRSTVQRMEAAIQAKEVFAICCVDLKNLVVYNEAYGVHRGDFLIREIASIIKRTVAQHGGDRIFVGHLGGDDFIILTEPELAETLSESIIDLFDKSVHAFYERADRERGYMLIKAKDGGYERHSFVSLSIAIITNEKMPFEHVAQITKAASQIHNYLKRFPASTYLKDRRTDHRHTLLIDESPAPAAGKAPRAAGSKVRGLNQKSQILAAVAHILKSGQVETYVQPIIHIRDRSAYGYEALSRFPSPEGSYWDPALVFRAAREANVIKEFDVLCAKRALQNARGLPRNAKLFINMNRETIMDPVCLAEVLKDAAVPPEQVVIELTEQSLVSQTAQIVGALKNLRQKGIQFAIDDMGGGSVSLRETADLKPDYIKFDGSLIRDIDTNETKQKILFSLLVFSKGIEARTTAEGIETRAEMDYLERCGIDFGQGYFIGKPAPAELVRDAGLPRG
jgi:EAL domain-containing protein (putative c-di-GMP-specific phosphodiesterase class I)/GGDEF domain-containing protein